MRKQPFEKPRKNEPCSSRSSDSVHVPPCEGTTCHIFTPPRTSTDWLALAALMLTSCFVFLWNLDASGYANEFYSAAAQAGSQNWEAFLWGSLDAGNAITVDKPPAAIWVMALSVRLLHLPVLRHHPPLLGQLGWHCRRPCVHIHPRCCPDVPLQQPRCFAGFADDRRFGLRITRA